MRIEIKPLTVNQAWQGRRFKTQKYKDYEEELLLLLKLKHVAKVSGFVNIHYELYIKEFKRSDVGNFEKPLTDIVVKAGLIDDDRFVKKITMEKFPSDENYLIIRIEKNAFKN